VLRVVVLRILANMFVPIVHSCAILQNCIRLSLILTKLCHIKREHPLNFYILLAKNLRKIPMQCYGGYPVSVYFLTRGVSVVVREHFQLCVLL